MENGLAIVPEATDGVKKSRRNGIESRDERRASPLRPRGVGIGRGRPSSRWASAEPGTSIAEPLDGVVSLDQEGCSCNFLSIGTNASMTSSTISGWAFTLGWMPSSIINDLSDVNLSTVNGISFAPVSRETSL